MARQPLTVFLSLAMISAIREKLEDGTRIMGFFELKFVSRKGLFANPSQLNLLGF